MLYTFVSNLEACRLDAELSDSDGTIVAILFENGSGWHLERLTSDRTILPKKFVQKVKTDIQRYVNRTGFQAPRGLTKGELSLWLLLKDDGTAMGLPFSAGNAPAGFYVESGCCLSCGVPQLVAPDLVGWVEEDTHCYWKKQPETPEELDRALKVLDQQELGCHRYAGSDPNILARVAPENCDHPAQTAERKLRPSSFKPTVLPENGPSFLSRLLAHLKKSR